MGAALSIVILFTVTSTIVRIAGVVLEHSGVPRQISRFQAESALTGAGFTTSESELLLQTPERRKVVSALMITGSIGLGSLIATVVVGAFGVSDTTSGLAGQVAAIAAALLFLRFVLLTPWADRLICGVASRWLERQVMGRMPFLLLYRLADDATIAEHKLARVPPSDPQDWGAASALVPIAVRVADGHIRHGWLDALDIGQGAILSGPVEAHLAFSTAYGQPITPSAH